MSAPKIFSHLEESKRNLRPSNLEETSTTWKVNLRCFRTTEGKTLMKTLLIQRRATMRQREKGIRVKAWRRNEFLMTPECSKTIAFIMMSMVERSRVT